MNISLEDYGEFADIIGLQATKKNGVFKYYHKKTGIEVSPFELGELYRLFISEQNKQIEYVLNHFKMILSNKKINKETLPAAFKQTFDDMQNYLQSQKNKIK